MTSSSSENNELLDAAGRKNEACANFPPPPRIVDRAMDLKQTMKLMGGNFRILNTVCVPEERLQAVRELEAWASQSQALGLQVAGGQPANADQRRQFRQGMIDLRRQIAVLETALESVDQVGASAALTRLNEIRKRNHELFIPK